jgi:antitoxin component YwqK of YwqJK toxin-antitoxin module
MKRSFATLIFVIPMLAYAVTPNHTNIFAGNYSDGDDPKATGYIDAAGLKQGYFIIYGKDVPEKTEYPLDGKVEEGTYKDNRKTGEWIMYHTDGKTPRLKGVYKDGRPNGPYTKIDKSGAICETGTFSNGKQTGAFTTIHPNGVTAQTKMFNAEGKTEGPVTFFYENGQTQFEFNSVNGVPVGEAKRYWPDGSVKEILTYSATGEVLETKVVSENPPTAVVAEKGSGGPSGSNGVMRDGKKFEADGYNKVYNKAEELWMDGQFKASKLWEGKLYKYDADGILLKIEIWKNGAYHSDGQL